MSQNTKIEWTDKTWNPVRGCSRVSEGCGSARGGGCYAERIAARFSGPGLWAEGIAENTPGGPRWTGRVELVPGKLAEPLSWRKPCRVFVNSMSDLFHEGLSDDDIARVFAVMSLASQHVFQVLTKRPARMAQLLSSREFVTLMDNHRGAEAGDFNWPLRHVWLGTSVEDQATANVRIPLLLDTPAAVRFVSAEPLLGPVDLSRWMMSKEQRYDRRTDAYQKFAIQARALPPSMADPAAYRPSLDWVITGGESGPGARPAHPQWFRDIRDACAAAEVAYFHKQNGAWADGDAIEAHGEAHHGWHEQHSEDGGVPCHTWYDGRFPDGRRCEGFDTIVYLVGKKAAGRLLDGIEHSAFPGGVS